MTYEKTIHTLSVEQVKVRSMSPEAKIRLDILRSAPLNSWIALSEDESRIVAVGETYAEVSERSDAAGESDPIILKTPAEWHPLSVSLR